MNTTPASRPIPLLLTALVGFFSALAALAVSNGHAHAHGSEPHAASAAIVVTHTPATETRKAVALRTDMRQLWETTSPGRAWRSSA